MNIWDILILIIIAGAVFLGMRSRRRRKGACCGSCGSCGADCRCDR